MHFPFSGCPEGSKQVLFCEGATKGTVQNITTLFFMGGGPSRGATSRRLAIIWACCHIMNYFCPKSFLIQFCTGATRNAHQENWGKIQNMPSQGFTCGLSHREVLPGRSSLGLPWQMTMVCASSTANFGTMVPFLVEMCIFAFPTTFATSVFPVST